MARSSSLGRLLKWDPISFVNEMGCDWNGMWLKKKKKSPFKALIMKGGERWGGYTLFWVGGRT